MCHPSSPRNSSADGLERALASRRIDLRAQGLDTPQGHLYLPQPVARQALMAVAAFAGGPLLAWLVAGIPGDLTETARTALCVPYVLVFFVGYGVWLARLNAIAFDVLGRHALGALFRLIAFRQKPRSLDEALPSRDQLLAMLVRGQRAGASFGWVAWPIGLLAGGMAILFTTSTGRIPMFLLVAGTAIGWGHLLARLGRRGWLPFPEEN